MKSILFAVLFLFVSPVVFATEISRPGGSLKNDPVEDGQSLYPGTYDAPLASENEITVDYVPDENTVDPDSVYAGFARAGTSGKNKLTFKNGHVARFVLGGFSLKGDAVKNSVVFSGGTAADAAIGKLCGGQTRNGDVKENSVTISGGKIIGDVYGGDADADGSAMENKVEIGGGEMSGFVNGGGVSGIGIARKNTVILSGGTVGMGISGGFAHFAAGLTPEPTESEKENVTEKTNSALENTVKISGKTKVDGNVSGGFVLDSSGSANKNSVEISAGTIRGNVYGGRAFNGEASGNTIVISGGSIKDRDEVVYAGYVHKPENGRAAGNSITITGSPDLKTITFYGNNLSTWQTDGNTLNFVKFHGTVRGISHFQNVHIDKDSRVTLAGEGPYEIGNLKNEGRLLHQDGALTIHGGTSIE